MYTDHIILDFEMNPISTAYHRTNRHFRSEIIEIGAVRLNRNFEETDRFQCYVRPVCNDHIMPEIVSLTGISDRHVCCAPELETALEWFEAWIGSGNVRVYSWSDSDYWQLSDECEEKGLPFPRNMGRWMDLQMVYPRMLCLPGVHRLSLENAARGAGLLFSGEEAHDALYDARITAKLLLPLLNGEYRARAEKNRRCYAASQSNSCTIAELCPQLKALAERLKATA